jgi:hypothetical protein
MKHLPYVLAVVSLIGGRALYAANPLPTPSASPASQTTKRKVHSAEKQEPGGQRGVRRLRRQYQDHDGQGRKRPDFERATGKQGDQGGLSVAFEERRPRDADVAHQRAG